MKKISEVERHDRRWLNYHFSDTTNKALRKAKIYPQVIHLYNAHELLEKKMTRKVIEEIDTLLRRDRSGIGLKKSPAEEKFSGLLREKNITISQDEEIKLLYLIRHKRYKPKSLATQGVANGIIELYKKVLRK